MMKTRVFALVLALMCLALGLSAAPAEEKSVAARLVLYALDKTDIGFVELLDDVPAENLDEFTFYEDGTAVAEIRYAETPAMPALHLEGTWTHYDVAGKELYEFAFADPNTGAQVSWPLERVGHGFALDAFSGAAGNRRLLRLEGTADPTESGAPENPPAAADGDAPDELPEIIGRFNVPFDGTADEHRQALAMWARSMINQSADLTLAGSGAGDGYAWERYDIPERSGGGQDAGESARNYHIYLILNAEGTRVLAYVGVSTMDMAISVDTFAEALRTVESDMGNLAKSKEIAEQFDYDRMERELDAMYAAIQTPGAGAATAYYRYGHYLTVVPDERDGEPLYWMIYHNTPEAGTGEAAQAEVEAPEPEPAAPEAEPEAAAPEAAVAETDAAADEAWTCENGHEGNTGKFCVECGAPKPVRPTVNFCPECGYDLRGQDVKFCPECGAPIA